MHIYNQNFFFLHMANILKLCIADLCRQGQWMFSDLFYMYYQYMISIYKYIYYLMKHECTIAMDLYVHVFKHKYE